MSDGGELQSLLEAGRYWECLAMGRILLEEPISETERAWVLSALCRCHLALGQMQGAALSGQKAVALARDLGLHDLEGSALLNQASALTGLRRDEDALAALEAFRRGLSAYTASRYLEGTASLQTGEALVRLGRAAEALHAYERAYRWFQRQGDADAAGESLLGILETALSAQDQEGAERWLEEAEQHAATYLDDGAFTGRLLLARARIHELAGRPQASADEAFRALMVAHQLTPLQVEAQLHLSRMAETLDRPVEALSFALAARISAIDGRHYALEFEASALLMRLVRRYGSAPVAELAVELERQGVDLYQYIDPAEIEQLARGE